VSATRYADHFVLTQGPFQHWQSALIVIPESKRSAADKITLGQQSLGCVSRGLLEDFRRLVDH
jgi:hypothetical protein